MIQRKHILTFCITILLMFGAVSRVHAQSLKFELVNPSQPIQVGDTFSVKILINTAGVQTINADALFTFDPDKVSIDEVTSGQFYTYFSDTPLSGDDTQYLISSWEESVAHAKSSSSDTLFATMKMSAKANGSAPLTFVCTQGSEADSNINQASDSEDILTNCSALQQLALTIGGTSGTGPTSVPGGPTSAAPTSGAGAAPTVAPTATPRPTATPIPTATPRPTSVPVPTVEALPRAGAVEMTVAAVGIGVVLTMAGVLFML